MRKRKPQPVMLDMTVYLPAEASCQHDFVQWGDDPRYKRCHLCGFQLASDVSNEARYATISIELRPVRRHQHGHTFKPFASDMRYERCGCGTARKAGAGGVA